jgi:hypothetical protein
MTKQTPLHRLARYGCYAASKAIIAVLRIGVNARYHGGLMVVLVEGMLLPLCCPVRPAAGWGLGSELLNRKPLCPAAGSLALPPESPRHSACLHPCAVGSARLRRRGPSRAGAAVRRRHRRRLPGQPRAQHAGAGGHCGAAMRRGGSEHVGGARLSPWRRVLTCQRRRA